jgi:hypothetical protein
MLNNEVNPKTLSRLELLKLAHTLNVSDADVMTRAELRAAIERARKPDPRPSPQPVTWLGVARRLLASIVEQGLHLPDAAAVIRGEAALRPFPSGPPPVATVTLARIYAAQGHLERGIGTLDEVLKSDPDHDLARELRAQLQTSLEERRRQEREQRASDAAAAKVAAAAAASAESELEEPTREDGSPASDLLGAVARAAGVSPADALSSDEITLSSGAAAGHDSISTAGPSAGAEPETQRGSPADSVAPAPIPTSDVAPLSDAPLLSDALLNSAAPPSDALLNGAAPPSDALLNDGAVPPSDALLNGAAPPSDALLNGAPSPSDPRIESTAEPIFVATPAAAELASRAEPSCAEPTSVGIAGVEGARVGTAVAESACAQTAVAESASVGTAVAGSACAQTAAAESASVGTAVAESASVGTAVAGSACAQTAESSPAADPTAAEPDAAAAARAAVEARPAGLVLIETNEPCKYLYWELASPPPAVNGNGAEPHWVCVVSYTPRETGSERRERRFPVQHIMGAVRLEGLEPHAVVRAKLSRGEAPEAPPLVVAGSVWAREVTALDRAEPRFVPHAAAQPGALAARAADHLADAAPIYC